MSTAEKDSLKGEKRLEDKVNIDRKIIVYKHKVTKADLPKYDAGLISIFKSFKYTHTIFSETYNTT